MKNIVKQSVDGLNDILNSKFFNNSLKKENFINFVTIHEKEEENEIQFIKLQNLNKNNIQNSNEDQNKNAINNNLKKTNSINDEKYVKMKINNQKTLQSYKNKSIKLSINKKSNLELNKPKISDAIMLKKRNEENRSGINYTKQNNKTLREKKIFNGN